MSQIFLFRHGQAGTREDYDRLSDLGREQALHLGRWIEAESLTFDRILCGALQRQRETAELALGPAGVFEVDPKWSEFDLDSVYSGIAPQLAADNPAFRAHWNELQRTIASGDSGIHRRWTKPDAAVVEAWIRHTYTTPTESWEQFVDRVLAAGELFSRLPNDARIAVFTSATPVSVWVSHVLGLTDPRRIMRFAGAALNTGITVLHGHDGALDLFTFNGVPHLSDPGLRTFR